MSKTDYRTVLRHEPSLWLRNELQAIGQEWLAGAGTACGHVTIPMVTALWNHQFTCFDCREDLTVLGEPDNHTCDRCSDVVDTIQCSVLDYGILMVCIGLCADCHGREAGTA